MQVLAGVLVKYVNFGKGWRHRLFVLQDGVLRYYKVGHCTTLLTKISVDVQWRGVVSSLLAKRMKGVHSSAGIWRGQSECACPV